VRTHPDIGLTTTLLQGDNNLFQTCHNNWEQAVRTHPDIGLTTTLLQLVRRSLTTYALLYSTKSILEVIVQIKFYFIFNSLQILKKLNRLYYK
jgi:hypothetical protein